MASARQTLRAVLDPKSVAIVGASQDPNKIGGRPLHYLGRHGYGGEIYPINPNREQVQGHKAYSDLAALPAVPDVAIIAVAGDAAVDAVDICADMGVKVAVVMASGFGEVDPVAGKAKEARMRRAARNAGMRVVGPNSQGLANFGTGAVLSFSTMYLEMAPEPGPVAVISQSGAMSVVPYALLRARGIGVRHSHATGNDCDVSVGEFASIVAEDPQVKLLLLYLESIANAQSLAMLARVAHDRNLPVVALKSGRTEAGQVAAQSHTGALANEDRVVEAFFEQHGIRRAYNTEELVSATELYLKDWRPRGKRLVAISNSGAACVMAADSATQSGMSIAKLSSDTRGELEKVLPNFATATNPIDLTAALLSNNRLFSDILPIVSRDPGADAVLISVPVAGQGYDVDAFARDSADFARSTGLPVAISATQDSVANVFRDEGLATFATEAQAIAAMAQYLSHVELMSGVERTGETDEVVGDSLAAMSGSNQSDGKQVMLNEAAALTKVGQFGIPVVEFALCHDEDAAADAFSRLGGPVAMKGCSRDIVHKSELGLVRLGLSSREAVLAAFSAISSSMKTNALANDGVIVARMANGRRELMLGGRIDPVFGPVVIVGDGGKYVESMPDARVLIWPFDEAQVLRAMARLRIAPLLNGVRSESGLDAQAVAQTAVAVGRMLSDQASGVENLDLNPLMVGSVGEGCLALDAVVYVRETA